MSFTEADYDRYSGIDGQGLEIATSKMDAVVTGFKQGWASSPFKSVVNYAISTSGKKYMTPLEANEKYNLTNTDYAFKDGDELISDEHAENVARENLYRRNYEIAMERVEQDYGAIGSVFNFAGNLAAGFADPLNLAVSFGTGLAIAKGVSKFGTTALKEVVKGRTFGDVAAREMILNTTESVLIDAALTPAGEAALNREVDLKTRIANVAGSALLGGAIGTAFELPALRQVQKITNAVSRSMGDRGAEMMERATIHATMNVANNKKPNPNFPQLQMELEDYRARPEQKRYIPENLYSDNIYNKPFFIGRNIESNNFDIVGLHGRGTILVTDNFNYAHNRVQPLDNSKSGEVLTFNISKSAKILTDDLFQGTKPQLRKAALDLFDSLSRTNKGSRSKFVSRLNTTMDTAVTFNDFKEKLMDILDKDTTDVHGIKGESGVDDFFNVALHNIGYDGYHATLRAVQLEDTFHNGVVLFAPEKFTKKTQLEERYNPTQESLFVGKGIPNLKNITGRGVVESSDGFGIFYNSGLFSNPKASKTVAFDPNHKNAAEYMRPLQENEKAEIKRMTDVTEDIDYDGKAAAAARSAPEAQPEQFDAIQDLLDSEGLSLEDVDPNAEPMKFINKSDEAKKKDALAVFEECIK